ncbi:MAG: DUF2007 domain-containing protein [Acidobacteriia bacterium]|nr:DUF2007 domain-containing protein [Terriglobia bacterium]
MFCPQCHDEYRDGFTECAECQVSLVERLPPDPPEPNHTSSELITVFTTGDAALLPFVESLLNGAGIQFFVKNEGAQDLFGMGRIGTSFNVVTGPVVIQVATEDAGGARELLRPLIERSPESATSE